MTALTPHPLLATFFGLHWVDALIVVVYMLAVLAIGKALSHGVKCEKDFFL
ncbi:MAG: Sodium:solute symporter family protein, partial [Verrucomicrobiota bacterium]|nr:Sodium:solute symporter family protein [Verrucomicrobiota bacterium]